MTDTKLHPEADSNTIEPLEGEPGIPSVTQPRKVAISRKGIFAVAFVALALIAGSAFWVGQMYPSSRKDPDKRLADRPTAAANEPRQLDMTLPPIAKASAPEPRIPALIPRADEQPDPIGVRRNAQTPSTSAAKQIAPEDAPVVLVSSRPGLAGTSTARAPSQGAAPTTDSQEEPLEGTRRNLDGYQRQLQGLLDTLTKSTALATNGSISATQRSTAGLPVLGGLQSAITGSVGGNAPGGLFGGQLQGSATPRVAAGQLANRSLTLAKGTAFTCALKTRVVSATSGFVSCQVQRNVYGDDGRVLLIERGSHVDGEYRIATVRPGTVRIAVLWTRIRTPLGVTVDIDSPGTGPLGESGVDGYVDNRWRERIGAAMLLSLIDDSVKLLIQDQANDREADAIVLPSTTSSGSKLAEKVLDSTINIPPLIYQNQGAIVGIYVARDVDFTSVYELKAIAR
jgi:type IV secretion system protein VirB10